jgi:hypothetical protein
MILAAWNIELLGNLREVPAAITCPTVVLAATPKAILAGFVSQVISTALTLEVSIEGNFVASAAVSKVETSVVVITTV